MLYSNQNTRGTKSILDEIYSRRSVRNYTNEVVDSKIVEELLDSAIQAPCAMHEEPCAFVIVQDSMILKNLSKEIKMQIQSQKISNAPFSQQINDAIKSDKFEVFYNANTLIIICAQFSGKFTTADCWLAAENLMLAAQAKGLGSCVIGLAVEVLNTKKWKDKLNIPIQAKIIAPIILGRPAGSIPIVSRNPPKIFSWKALELSGPKYAI